MIIVGDIATGTESHAKDLNEVFESNINIFKGKLLLCNFEGLVNDSILSYSTPVLMNHPSVIPVLKNRGPVVAALANNHTLDLAKRFDDTISVFKSKNVYYLGAGHSSVEAANALKINESSQDVVVFNACWDFLLYNQKNPTNGIYVSLIDELNLIRKVKEVKTDNPEASIIVYLHWNFDLETLPFPMHRQFAKDLIDAGANVVAGAHSHCVQGGEKHKDGYIIYGLGNFFIPHGFFANGLISYPALANIELVMEWNNTDKTAHLHWFEYGYDGKKHSLNFLLSEKFEESVMLRKYSPYADMNEMEYLTYFKRHRRKKRFIPIYADYHRHKENYFKTLFLKSRARIARKLAQLNLIKWQN